MASIHSDEKPQSAKVSELFDSLANEETVDAVKELVGQSVDQARRFVRENPVAAVAVGFGIGVLIGAWLRKD